MSGGAGSSDVSGHSGVGEVDLVSGADKPVVFTVAPTGSTVFGLGSPAMMQRTVPSYFDSSEAATPSATATCLASPVVAAVSGRVVTTNAAGTVPVASAVATFNTVLASQASGSSIPVTSWKDNVLTIVFADEATLKEVEKFLSIASELYETDSDIGPVPFEAKASYLDMTLSIQSVVGSPVFGVEKALKVLRDNFVLSEKKYSALLDLIGSKDSTVCATVSAAASL